MKLTDQQQAIVQHLRGPGLVFAVAGAGKTTCMVHRIRNLVDKKVCRPPEILATSFSKATVSDLTEQLQRLHVPVAQKSAGVDCRTLHSLGFRIIRGAVRRGYLDKSWLRNAGGENHTNPLIGRTLTKMAIEDGTAVHELNVDREDLQNQIAIWKGNLIYADLDNAALPDAALKFARQAAHENGQYLRAYRLYEQIRVERNIITFDDMLMTGWELLVRYPDILQSVQSSYRSVMVDEFQDVNFAQYQLLDLISRPHGNYMAIGDDDQCIYEWRGAIPGFILNFEKTYGATVFTISDNFRSQAQQIMPANAVIAKNKTRYPKFLSLTRGFDGQTHLLEKKDDWEIARHIAGEIHQRIETGESPETMSVLIRLYSQTAFLETAFIDRQIPYEIVGSKEFYKRDEVIPLFQYLSFAFAEQEIRKNGFPEDQISAKKYLEMFSNIINRPRRYIPKEAVENVVAMARRRHRSVIEVLLAQKQGLHRRVQDQADDFAELIRLLMLRLKRPAHKVLRWLVDEIDYEDHLLNYSGRREIGLSRIQTIEAVIEFARAKNRRCRDFLDYIRNISLNPIANPRNLPPIKIMTIYRAKGLEWDTVFVPGCYDGLAPCIVAEDGVTETDLQRTTEAERRLFYVAMTRARQTLFLYFPKEEGMTSFLKDADAPNVLKNVEKLHSQLFDKSKSLREADVFWLCQQLGAFQLARYFSRWANFPKIAGEALKAHLASLETQIAAAEAAEQEYQTALSEYQQQGKRAEQQRREKEREIRDAVVLIRKFKSAYYPVKTGQKLHFELFDDGNVVVLSERGMAGMVDFDEMPKFDCAAVQWEKSAIEITHILSDTLAEARFTTLVFDNVHLSSQISGWRAPLPPPEKLRRFLAPNLRKGLKILKKLL